MWVAQTQLEVEAERTACHSIRRGLYVSLFTFVRIHLICPSVRVSSPLTHSSDLSVCTYLYLPLYVYIQHSQHSTVQACLSPLMYSTRTLKIIILQLNSALNTWYYKTRTLLMLIVKSTRKCSSTISNFFSVRALVRTHISMKFLIDVHSPVPNWNYDHTWRNG